MLFKIGTEVLNLMSFARLVDSSWVMSKLQINKHLRGTCRFAVLQILGLVCIWGTWGGTSWGQDQPSVPPPIRAGTAQDVQVVIKAVQQSNPRSAEQLATALATMLDLEAMEQAKFYLERLRALSLNDQQKFELYDSVGGNLFFELQFNESLAPSGAEFAKEVIRAANRVAGSTERLQQLIARLSSPDLSSRNEALRTLRRLGPRATAEILAVFSDMERQREFPYLRSALRLMGEDAIPPLLAGARSTHLLVQGESVRALTNYRTAEAMDVMMRTYLSPQVPEPLRRIALEALIQQNRLPADPQVVEDRFYDRAYALLLQQQSSQPTFMEELELWHWDDENRALVTTRVPATLANQMLAAQIAADLYEINPSVPRNRQLMLLTQLEFGKRQLDTSIKLSAGQALDLGYTPDELQQVLALALKLDLIPAATAASELLGKLAEGEESPFSNVPPSELIDAIKSGDRHLQFAAFQAIIKIDPRQAYPGSSLVLSLAVFLAASDGQDTALVGDHRRDFAQSYGAMLALAGVKGIASTTGKELFASAVSNPDVRAIIVTDSLTMPDFAALIQLLRRDMRTKKIPIGLLVREPTVNPPSGIERLQGLDDRDKQQDTAAEDLPPFYVPPGIARMAVADSLLTILPVSLDEDQVVAQIRQVKQTLQPWTVSGPDRKRHAVIALNWLSKIAADRQAYRFYDLGSYQQELAKTIYIPNSIEPATVILQNLGTPTAQKELLNFISQNNFPIEDRRRAATAFASIIKTSGTLLTRDEILRQYDRYNASEGESEEIQELLGRVLDALESKIGK